MSRLIQHLEKYDKDLTVQELIEKLESEQDQIKQEEQARFDSYRTKYKESYLKEIDEDSIFGKTLNVYYIMRLEGTGKNTDWETFYHISGNKLSFSPKDINFRGLNPQRVQDTFTEKQLDSMLVITKEEYKNYESKYYKITNELKNLIE
jgi:hypothetical protein